MAVAAATRRTASALGGWARRRPWVATAGGLVATAALGWAVTGALDATSRAVAGRLVSRPPVRVDVVETPLSARHSDFTPASWVLPGDVDEIPDAPPEQEGGRGAWAQALGGVDADETVVEVIVRGTADASVALLGLEVRVHERAAPLRGVVARQLGGDLLDVRSVDIDLDQEPPEIQLDSGFTPGEGAWRFPLEVSAAEAEYLYLIARTETCACAWDVVLSYAGPDGQGAVVVDDGGQPFRTTAATGLDEVVVEPDGAIVRR